jgi:hypothetical protein
MMRKRYHEPCARDGCKEAADSRCTFQAFGVNVYSCQIHSPLHNISLRIRMPFMAKDRAERGGDS